MAEKEIPVLITIPIEEELLQKLREISPLLLINLHPAKSPSEIPANIWEKTEILFTNYVLPEPDKAPSLKWIQFHWAGVDRMIDEPILKVPQITATTMSGASAPQMAEYVLAALLALGHKYPALFTNQREAGWPENRWEKFTPQELSTSTVGIVGYGSIGREVTRLLRTFGTTVLAVKRDAMQPAAEGYTPEGLGDPEGVLAHRIYPFQAVKQMLKECDFVVIALPLTPETIDFIGSDELEAIKTGAFLVDVSRGGIVNHQALLKALKSGKLRGAVLDVFPKEPLPKDNPLWKQSNALITPHIAGVSAHYDARAIDLFATNLRRYLADEPLYNQVDLERGY